MKSLHSNPFNAAVLAAGLGFFIDAFDLFLFNIYRIPSLKELGLSGSALTMAGERLLAIQMAGMMLGGILTGIIGDKKGRVAVLFGSIVLYSVANIVNAFVSSVEAYAVIRFLAGLGLAGELGAGITLVSESMTIEKRGYGTIFVATLGAAGAVTAGLAGDFLPWRQAFLFAGIAGLLLLLFRIRSIESSMFQHAKSTTQVARGSFALIFKSKQRLVKYLLCICMGIPIWYSVGLLITLSPELAANHGLENLSLTRCFILFQIGITAGDLSSGVLSQVLRTRKKVLVGFMVFAVLITAIHFLLLYNSSDVYVTSMLMGLGCGYLSVFVTTTAEQFGTNLRVLVTATVTNFMRGAVTILIPFHLWLEKSFSMSLSESLIITGLITWAIAITGALLLPDTFGKDLNYSEH